MSSNIRALVTRVAKTSPQLVGDYGRIDILLDLIVIIRGHYTIEDVTDIFKRIEPVHVEAIRTAKKIAQLRDVLSDEKDLWMNDMLIKLEQDTKGKSSAEQYAIVETQLALLARDWDTALRTQIPFLYQEENWAGGWSGTGPWYTKFLDNQNRYTTAALIRMSGLISKAYPDKAGDMKALQQLTSSLGSFAHNAMGETANHYLSKSSDPDKILDSLARDFTEVTEAAPPAPPAPVPKLQ